MLGKNLLWVAKQHGHSVEVIDWSKVGASETIVLFMGLVNFPQIARELIRHGRSPETKA